MTNLDPFQEQGAEWLASGTSKGKLLADEPGLGKTRQAIYAAVERSYYGETVYVLCPAAARAVWRRETAALGDGRRWMITGYNRAHLLDPAALTNCVVILDEAHYLKTPGSGRTADVFGPATDGKGGLIEFASLVICLTGTPTPNNPSEIWAMARACFPDAISKVLKDGTKKPMSFWQFAQRYCILKDQWMGDPKIMPGGKRVDELRARLQPYFLRRLKKDVYKDLKDPRHSVLPIEGKFDAHLRATGTMGYLTAARIFRERGVEGLAEIAPQTATLRRITGMAKVKGAVEWITEWIENDSGKLVVFAYHRDVIVGLQAGLAMRGIKVIAGGTPGAELLFQECPGARSVFLGQIQRDGVAITLTAAQTCLLVEQSWVPGENDQAWQRIHRRGQTGLCDVRWCALEGSIDEDIASALARKAGTINALWNGEPTARCAYPRCDCAISFPEGYSPSTATECPRCA